MTSIRRARHYPTDLNGYLVGYSALHDFIQPTSLWQKWQKIKIPDGENALFFSAWSLGLIDVFNRSDAEDHEQYAKTKTKLKELTGSPYRHRILPVDHEIMGIASKVSAYLHESGFQEDDEDHGDFDPVICIDIATATKWGLALLVSKTGYAGQLEATKAFAEGGFEDSSISVEYEVLEV